ncbi:MAG: 30S ribosomal protein S9 [Bacteroidales bacterium]|jgi:small subunit ribosomal protein S9|nr:30S ribosomal protein S9 [Bacteroidales bacterium]MBP5724528.1 30S ribosomal protein S9 [Bacteroidales bacterium]MBQ3675967.1 30S ribosomal protein S9 [Bacteroidales bacterium]MBQ4215122.1 30S ribosomal protein S9 [Bacteroidales bacterium]MBR4497865.1 30S ribosomal protein S9 [Bacteroidales bacterium]
MEVINALGRRKSAIARIYVKEGKGQITVNNRELDKYFAEERLRFIVKQPLSLLEKEGDFDIKVNLVGGGIKGQAEATRLAIARALVKMDEENKSPLKKQGFLTRDQREVERKKPGQKKARKRFQFSKR